LSYRLGTGWLNSSRLNVDLLGSGAQSDPSPRVCDENDLGVVVPHLGTLIEVLAAQRYADHA
jgi:hypothetical protein